MSRRNQARRRRRTYGRRQHEVRERRPELDRSRRVVAADAARRRLGRGRGHRRSRAAAAATRSAATSDDRPRGARAASGAVRVDPRPAARPVRGARPVAGSDRRRVARRDRADRRAHPVGMLLAVVLVAFLLGLIYLAQNIRLAAVNYEIDQSWSRARRHSSTDPDDRDQRAALGHGADRPRECSAPRVWISCRTRVRLVSPLTDARSDGQPPAAGPALARDGSSAPARSAFGLPTGRSAVAPELQRIADSQMARPVVADIERGDIVDRQRHSPRHDRLSRSPGRLSRT